MEYNNGEGSSVRPRWTPKQEQVVILESIYNSGVVNPPKDETTRIRKLLEDYGPVVDANVFYWFQNRRSRSRRRTRQIQAKINREQVLAHDPPPSTISQHQNPSSEEQIFGSSVSFSCLGGGQHPASQVCYPVNETNFGNSSLNNTCSADTSNVHYQSGLITVFINGVATEVPSRPLDMKGMFGEQDLVLFHSSGIQVPATN